MLPAAGCKDEKKLNSKKKFGRNVLTCCNLFEMRHLRDQKDLQV